MVYELLSSVHFYAVSRIYILSCHFFAAHQTLCIKAINFERQSMIVSNFFFFFFLLRKLDFILIF